MNEQGQKLDPQRSTVQRTGRIEGRQSCDITGIVVDILNLFKSRMAYENVELVADLDKYLPPTLADPHRLRQVILELVTHAMAAMTAKTHSGPRRLAVVTRQEGDTIFITVQDSGPGIDEDHLRRIFERGEGIGRGLIECRNIVTDHGGKMRGVNIEGGGTAFIIELPFEQ